mgnify:CR=1 FL=1
MKKIFCLRTGQDNEHVQGLCTSVFYAKNDRRQRQMCIRDRDNEHVQGLCTSVFYAKNDMLKECAQKIRIV